MTVTADEYRTALRRHPAGVAIITTNSPAGPVGFTATSLASLSLNPPLVSFNITHTSSSLAAVHAADSVIVHLIGAHQLEVARRFSRAAEHRFADESLWTTADSGEPLLRDTPTWLRTTLRELIPAGDSTLVIAEVTQVHCDTPTTAPLLYHDGSFAGIAAV